MESETQGILSFHRSVGSATDIPANSEYVHHVHTYWCCNDHQRVATSACAYQRIVDKSLPDLEVNWRGSRSWKNVTCNVCLNERNKDG